MFACLALQVDPINLTRAQIKGEVACENTIFCLKNMKTDRDCYQQSSTRNLGKVCKHALKTEETYWKTYGILKEMVAEFGIELASDSRGNDSDAFFDMEL